MTRQRKTRQLLLAFTALSVMTVPAFAQTGPGNGSGKFIPGLENPNPNRNPTPRVGITTSVGQTLEDPVAASPSEISTIGDNLGNHVAIQDMNLNGNDLVMRGGDIQSDGGRVLGIALTPAQESEASSKYYVDSLGADLSSAITVIEGDVQTLFDRRINTPVNQGLTGGGPLSTDLTLTVDGTVVRTGGDQTINGGKTFTGPVSLSGTRLLGVGTPELDSDGVNKVYVDRIGETLGGQIDQVEQTFLTRRVDTGTGLLGGGDLSQNRTLTFDTAWGDARYALRARTLAAGDGLTGGGTLAANRSFAVDASVVRTNGDQIINGGKTFTGLLSFSNKRLTSVDLPVVASDAATKGYVDGVRDELETDIISLSGRRIDTGTGLLGGGDLSANRTLTFDAAWGDLRYAQRQRSIVAGDGMTGGGDLSADRTFSVDTTVVRTGGSQLVSGAKTFRQGSGTLFEQASGQDGVLLRGRAGGVDGFSVTISPSPLSANQVLTLANGATTLVPGTMVPTTRSVLTGDGLAGGGNFGADRTLTVDTTVVRTMGAQAIGGDKSFSGTLALTGNRLTLVGTPIVASDAATKGYVDGLRDQLVTDIGTLSSRRINTGAGLSGGGDLSADRTLTFDAAWGDARYATLSGAQTISGAKTFTAAQNFSNQRLLRVATPTLGTDGVNKAYVDTAVAGAVGTTYTAGTGLNLAGTTFSITDLAAGSAEMGTVRYNGTTASAGRFYGGVTAPVSTTRLNYDGALYATQLFDAGVRVVGQTRSVAAGDGLSGGGNLSADRTIAVDATVVRTTRSVTAGTGLTGGGNLSADRALIFDTLWGDARYATLSGAQTISGAKTFTAAQNFSNQRLLGVATPTLGTDGVNKAYVDTAVAGAAGTTYDAGTGLNLAGTTFSITDLAAGSAEMGTVRYNGTTASAGRFYGGVTAPVSTTRLNYDGALYATQLFDAGVRVVGHTRSVAAGDGLSGGGDLSANRTLAFDTVWGDARYAEHVTGGFSNTMTYDDLLGAAGNGATTFGHSAAVRPQDSPVNTQVSGLHIGNTWGRAQVLFPNPTNRILFRNGTQTTWSEVWHSGNLTPADYAPVTRTITAGTGLSGGGDLYANRSLAFDAAWGDARYATLSGAQTISGAKTFTAAQNFSNQRLLGVATPTLGTDGVNKAYVDTAVAGAAGTTYDAGTGLTLTGTTFALAANQIRRNTTSVDQGVLAYNGEFPANAQFYGGTTNPTSTNTAHRVNFQGALYATRFYATQYFYFSDETLKENVTRLDGSEGMALLREIRPVRYDWKETGRESLGVIAQETARVLPNIVDTDPNGIMSVDYIQLIAPLIAAVQELDARVTELEGATARSAP